MRSRVRMTAGLACLTMGGELPGMKFFQPKRQFIDWMRAHHKGLIYDVGAGIGHVSAALDAAGMDVKALDVYHRTKMEYEVMIADGTIYPYEAGSTVMLARPCHGVFVEDVVINAEVREAALVIYVGKPGKAEDDLADHYRHFTKVLSNAGEDSEEVWAWRP